MEAPDFGLVVVVGLEVDVEVDDENGEVVVVVPDSSAVACATRAAPCL